MSKLVYFSDTRGRLCARWPGKSVFVKGVGPRKEGQRHLGLVINKEQNIFWNRAQGYYVFDPATGTYRDPDPMDIPDANSLQPDGCMPQNPPCYIDFGDSFFLDQLIKGIGYDQVIDKIAFGNRDTLYAMIQQYALEGRASTQAYTWYRSSYASYLYPKANLATQRISDLLKSVGRPENRRAFLEEHIKYVLESTDKDLCVLIDSTGMPNSCDIPITCVSKHEGDVNIEFRLIAVVQKRTGLPLFYEVVAGNIVDITTLEHTITKIENYGMRVSYVIGDAGYCCPRVIERLLLHGIDFMTRLAPQYKLFKNAVKNHMEELDNPKSLTKFKGRCVRIVKFSEEIAMDIETGEMKSCFIYLCRDELGYHSKSKHLFASDKAATMTSQELTEAAERMGLFAIISTEDLPAEDLLPEYYIRQNIEQYFDFGKNYANFLPVRQHSVPAINGHLLISFIVTFIVILIKNRLNLMDTKYVCTPPKLYLNKPDGKVEVALEEFNEELDKDIMIIEQDPLGDIFSESPASLFLSLRGLKAEVFDTMIQPDIARKDQREYLEAFGLANPTQISRLSEKLLPVYKIPPQGVTKVRTFTFPSPLTDEEIAEKRKAKEEKNAKKAEKEDAGATTDEKKSEVSQDAKSASAPGELCQKKRGGRKRGAKNKKTLEREAAIARGEIEPPKPKRAYHRRNKPPEAQDGGPKS